ncbi:MAG TPA: type 1 glutamine amidotransferase [candidate division Zixibacteria bacterium]|nr:type 1 glutamine amidotransferase [candidate division Zixibacteria bacterium]
MKPVLLIQNTPFESPGCVPSYLNDRGMPFSLVRSFEDGASFPAVESVSAVINFGCPHSVTRYTEHDFLKTLYSFVAQAVRANTSYLGICFGGQLLAKILGARVEANPVKEIGTYQVELTAEGKSDPLFAGFPERFPVFHWHGDTFRIPFDATHLVSGADCRNQAFRQGKFVALQFHLEALADEVPSWCNSYADELNEFGKTKGAIADAYQAIAAESEELGHRLLDNFFALVSRDN